MTSEAWLPLSSAERNLLREALAALAQTDTVYREQIDKLKKKIGKAKPLPGTVLRVEGGFVDVETNPNSVRIYDYDCEGEDEEYLCPDESGRLCILSEYEAAP